jgi:phospholipid-translocating ATPase
MSVQFSEEGVGSKPTKRLRWATQRVTGQSGRRKRHSIMDRFHKNPGSSEKQRESGGSDLTQGEPDAARAQEDDKAQDDESEQENGQRRIFFNIPLPDDAKDDDGHPIQDFGKNKIRTAKYTPLSFVPKNLWFQFHNIANIYFLFVIILAVSMTPLPICTHSKSVLIIDIPHLRCFKSCARCGSAHRYPLCYCCQRCY